MIEVNPITALSVFFSIVLFLLLFFWPKKGIKALYKKFIKTTNRVFIEDALKHLYDYEYHNMDSTLSSIAGNLGISTDKASKIIESLKSLDLIRISNRLIFLTTSGKSYALRIIRVHRLWENYLAEETSIKELDWHEEAEKVEHTMTFEEADKLSAKMGNPKYDPHGDPIPTNEGNLPENKGQHLNSVNTGEVAKIKHIEDEPKAIYTQLVAQGLYPGKEILILNKDDDKIVIAADGEEKIIAPLLASKVTIEIVNNKAFQNEKRKTLLDLKLGEEGEVLNVSPTCRGQQRRRLLDFGIVPGTKISILMNSPLSDPVAYMVKDTIVALRKSHANKILIKT